MKTDFPWTSWVSRRFLTGRRGGRGRLVFLFSVLLLGVGVATLNTILAVMNGLQQGYIRSILEIGSYHLRWTPESPDFHGDDFETVLNIIEDDSGTTLATPFREGQTMLRGKRPRPVGALLRGVPPGLYIEDESLASRLNIVDGAFDLQGYGVVLGDELALDLGVSPGEQLTVLNLAGAGFSTSEIVLEVRGLFQCGYRQYESSLGFVSLETASLFLPDAPVEIGVKLNRAESDRSALARLVRHPELSRGTLISWRESNRAFFGALRTEKVMMLLLLTLIFVVAAVNIDHSLRRMVTERVEDLSILKALGASPRDIRVLFWRHGLFIGGMGGISGSLVGMLVGDNVDAILRFVRKVRGLFLLPARSPLGGQSMEAFFRSSEVMLQDVVVILVLVLLLSSLAALRAASMAARSKPAEVLRSE